MFEKIVDILSEHTEYDKSKMNRDTTLLMDLGLNSLEVVKIVMELEEEFEIEFSEEDLPRITTLGELEDLIKEMTEERGEIMVIGIMQPYFFPFLGYWQLMNAVDEYLIIDDVNYIKGGYINRNRTKDASHRLELMFQVC